jgi:hypothetical protein
VAGTYLGGACFRGLMLSLPPVALLLCFRTPAQLPCFRILDVVIVSRFIRDVAWEAQLAPRGRIAVLLWAGTASDFALVGKCR